MTFFSIGSFQFKLLLAAALSVSMWPTASKAYTPEQEQACTGDAFRLCGAEIPDVNRVTACMVAKKSQLSPGAVQARSERGCGQAGGQAHGHPACAQAGERQAAQGQETVIQAGKA